MIIVDQALRARDDEHRPIRVGMVGAGAMGRAIANQIVCSVPGMEIVAISNRHTQAASAAYVEAGIDAIDLVRSVADLESVLRRHRVAVTDDPSLLCRADGIDAVLEVTGTVDFGAGVVLEAVRNGKPVVLMNAELEATLGPILKAHADQFGMIVSGCDGDQPGVELNLYRFVRSLGLTPLVCGNIKGLQDHYRTPATQQHFAERWGLTPQMATSFADGTKISFEQATVANATGMRVAERGMGGRRFDGHVDELTSVYDVDELRRLGGIVDYVVGAQPAPGVFVLAAHEDPRQRRFLELYKRGSGPLYSFYTPYHLCHFEVPLSVARVVLFKDAVTAPAGGPVVHVICTAKRDLEAGEILDGIGGYMTYGQCENADVVVEQALLPMGLAAGCRLRHAVARDQVLTYDDVELPANRLADQLWREQVEQFSATNVGAATWRS
jgi:predicted homoserine dehydrogenase-like protein